MSKILIDELKRIRSIIYNAAGQSPDDEESLTEAYKSIDRLIEQPAQEPVAWALEWTFNGEDVGRRLYDDETHCKFDAGQDGGVCRPLVYGDITPPAPAQRKYRRGDRLICLETEDYCIIHISGTDRQWVKFPDTKIGVYTNEQLAELFELLPKEIEQEQPAPSDMKQAIIVEASIQMTGHPSKDARWFAESVYEYLMAEQPAPVQESVAWTDGPHLIVRSDWRDRMNFKGPWVDLGRAIPDSWVPVLYTTPPAPAPAPAQPLTDEQIADYLGDEYHIMTESELRFFKLGEQAAHGITKKGGAA
jgi:hypothetical protein